MTFNTRYHLPAILWAAVILVLTSIPRLSLPDINVSLEDKVAHLTVYFVLAFLTLRAIVANFPEIQAKHVKLVLLMTVSFAIFDELHQIPIPGRYGEWGDLLADVLGIVLAVLLYRLVFPLLVKKNKREDSYA